MFLLLSILYALLGKPKKGILHYSKETCLVGWICGRGQQKSECLRRPVYPKCPYVPVMVGEKFYVAQTVIDGKNKNGVFHKNCDCPLFSRATSKVPVSAEWVHQKRLRGCKGCAPNIGELTVTYCGGHSADSWQKS
eukprot:GEMP01119139.1.p1 GENE.GEMP01119139.1~~GEMP01119139.1.p1  ORF type:complete len:136 (+),score=10.77 GEMP01119139.1:73-480(+)